MKNNKFSFLRDKDFMGQLVALTIPIVLQSLMLASVAVTDTFMLGSVDQNSMAAVSLATQVQFVQNMIIYAAVTGASILGAQYWGKKDENALKDIYVISLRFSGITSFVFWIGCIFFPKYLMLIFTDNLELIEIGISYLKIAGWSYLLTGISQIYLTMMKVTDHAKDTAIISSGAVVINIILNAFLIYGLCGLPAMGVHGAAVATLIARAIELMWALIYSYRKNYIHPNLKNWFGNNKALTMDFIKLGLPLLWASLFWGVGFTSYTAFMGHLGTDAAAANSIAAVVRDLVCCMCNGLSAGGGILVGNQLGAGDLEKGKNYGDRVAWISVIVGFLSTAIMLLVTPVLLKCVKLTPGASKLLLGMMVIMAFYMIGRAINSVLINGIFDAGGDTVFDVYSLAVCMWGIAVPLAFLGTFVFHWPVLVVYGCTCLDEVGKIPWVIHHYKKYKWVKDLTRTQTE